MSACMEDDLLQMRTELCSIKLAHFLLAPLGQSINSYKKLLKRIHMLTSWQKWSFNKCQLSQAHVIWFLKHLKKHWKIKKIPLLVFLQWPPKSAKGELCEMRSCISCQQVTLWWPADCLSCRFVFQIRAAINLIWTFLVFVLWFSVFAWLNCTAIPSLLCVLRLTLEPFLAVDNKDSELLAVKNVTLKWSSGIPHEGWTRRLSNQFSWKFSTVRHSSLTCSGLSPGVAA